MYDFTENNSGGILFVASKKTPCFMYTAEEKYANVNTWEQCSGDTRNKLSDTAPRRHLFQERGKCETGVMVAVVCRCVGGMGGGWLPC